MGDVVRARCRDSNWRIATERVKWSVKYQKRHGIDTARGAAADGDGARRSSTWPSARIARWTCQATPVIDFRMDANGKPYVIEANANPQLAQDEDFAQSALHAGLSYGQLLDRLMSLGLQWQPARMG